MGAFASTQLLAVDQSSGHKYRLPAKRLNPLKHRGLNYVSKDAPAAFSTRPCFSTCSACASMPSGISRFSGLQVSVRRRTKAHATIPWEYGPWRRVRRKFQSFNAHFIPPSCLLAVKHSPYYFILRRAELTSTFLPYREKATRACVVYRANSAGPRAALPSPCAGSVSASFCRLQRRLVLNLYNLIINLGI